MLCILPEDASSDVALHIHFTLIEAFCWENDIRVVKVQFESKLHNYLGQHISEVVPVFRARGSMAMRPRARGRWGVGRVSLSHQWWSLGRGRILKGFINNAQHM